MDTERKLNKQESLSGEIISNTETRHSLWTNLWYGLGMLAFSLIPVLIPGMTIQITVLGLYALIIGIYVIAAVSFIIRNQKSTRHRRSRSRK